MTDTQQHSSVASHIVPTQEERVIDALLLEWDKDVLKVSRDELVELTGLTRQQITRVLSKLKKNEVIVEIPLSEIPFHNAYALTSNKLAEYRPNGKGQDHRKAPRLRLTIEQQEMLAKTTADILMERPTCDFWIAAQEAQTVLPEDRRRPFEKLKAPNVKKWLVPMVEKEKEKLQVAPVQSEEKVEEPVVEQSMSQSIHDFSLDELIHELGSRLSVQIAEEVTTRVRSALSRDLTDALRKIEEEYQGSETVTAEQPPKKHVVGDLKKPKVLVVGLLNQQQQEIKKEFGDFMDLRFHKTEKGSVSKNLESQASDVDIAVIMTRWMSHPEERMVRKATDNYVRVPGGVSMLKEELHKFYSNW